MRKFISGLLIGILLTLSITTFAAVELDIIPNPYKVLIDGKTSDVQGYNINGSTYLKLTDFVEAGLGVNFDKNTKQIEITTTVEQKEGESVGKQPSNSNNQTQSNTSTTKPETLDVIDVTFDNGASKN